MDKKLEEVEGEYSLDKQKREFKSSFSKFFLEKKFNLSTHVVKLAFSNPKKEKKRS